MKNNQTIPYFAFNDTYEVVYRKGSNSYPVNPHTHNALEIYFTLTDLPDVLLDDTVSSVSSGSLIVIPPHYIHQLFNQKLTIYERYIITISSSWLNNVLGVSSTLMPYALASSEPVIINLSPENVNLLRSLLNNYLDRHSKASISDLAGFFSLLNTVDCFITEGLSRTTSTARLISKSQQHVNEIISYINENLTGSLSLENISSHFYLNKDYLNRLFKEHTHATIGHYISMQRTGLAQSMLSDGFTVLEVTEKLGFTSYAYFFKFFKKMTGISPSQYRKSAITK